MSVRDTCYCSRNRDPIRDERAKESISHRQSSDNILRSTECIPQSQKSQERKSKLTLLDPLISYSWVAANESSHHILRGI